MATKQNDNALIQQLPKKLTQITNNREAELTEAVDTTKREVKDMTTGKVKDTTMEVEGIGEDIEEDIAVGAAIEDEDIVVGAHHLATSVKVHHTIQMPIRNVLDVRDGVIFRTTARL